MEKPTASQSKLPYFLRVSGCDAETIVHIDLTDQEHDLLIEINNRVNTEALHSGCKPTMDLKHVCNTTKCGKCGTCEDFEESNNDTICYNCSL